MNEVAAQHALWWFGGSAAALAILFGISRVCRYLQNWAERMSRAHDALNVMFEHADALVRSDRTPDDVARFVYFLHAEGAYPWLAQEVQEEAGRDRRTLGENLPGWNKLKKPERERVLACADAAVRCSVHMNASEKYDRLLFEGTRTYNVAVLASIFASRPKDDLA